MHSQEGKEQSELLWKDRQDWRTMSRGFSSIAEMIAVFKNANIMQASGRFKKSKSPRVLVFPNLGKSMATDSLLFKDDGKPSFKADPCQKGVVFCAHCGTWHERLQFDNRKEFCAFCLTTHHSRACGAGLGEKCIQPEADPIHEFITRECQNHQRFDLSFCRECNCFHSKEAWKVCLLKNKLEPSWSAERKQIWKLRWSVCDTGKSLQTDRSLFDSRELSRLTPLEYPLSSGRFVRNCKV